MRRFLCMGVFLLVLNILANAQGKKYKIAIVAFYNLENLYDTINDPDKDDEEFLPEGKYNWTGKRYWAKQKNMSEVIAQLGQDLLKGGPTIMGLAEVENKQVVLNLINQPALKGSGYDVVHYDSPDKRGVDVAFIYRKKRFTVTGSRAVPLYYPEEKDFATRDQLVVSGLLDGEPVHVIVNHWPSRRGGEEKSSPKRDAAAKLCLSISDSIRKIKADAKIIIMGDLNDDPVDESIAKTLNAIGKIEKVVSNDFFNPMWKLFKDGVGSLAYKDVWNLFDQIIVSGTLTGDDRSAYKFLRAKVFNEKFLRQKEGNFEGYPFRTYVGETYYGGYSDHFPVYIFLTKELK
ncbi:MAG: endonuclease/exonuclease/phosphatase family protein [Bacteroidia bacterium]|nr:endonuclease/exonuclease/phosphatase family protein [Bacteroidia bacterium]